VRPLTCQEVLEQLSEYLDAELKAERAGAIDQHLMICEHCRIEVYTMRRTILIYRCEQHVITPDGIGQKLQQALHREYAGGDRNPEGGEGQV